MNEMKLKDRNEISLKRLFKKIGISGIILVSGVVWAIVCSIIFAPLESNSALRVLWEITANLSSWLGVVFFAGLVTMHIANEILIQTDNLPQNPTL